MTEEEQVAICKAIAVSTMWGQGGIAAIIVERMDRHGPAAPMGWHECLQENAESARRESVGIITDETELRSYLQRGYWLANFNDDGCDLFNPPPMNGLCKYVSKELAGRLPRPFTSTQTQRS